MSKSSNFFSLYPLFQPSELRVVAGSGSCSILKGFSTKTRTSISGATAINSLLPNVADINAPTNWYTVQDEYPDYFQFYASDMIVYPVLENESTSTYMRCQVYSGGIMLADITFRGGGIGGTIAGSRIMGRYFEDCFFKDDLTIRFARQGNLTSPNSVISFGDYKIIKYSAISI